MSQWIKTNGKKMTSPLNRELITGRIVNRNNRLRIYFSLGRTICELIGFVPKAYVNVFIHRTQNDIVLIRKAETFGQGYKLLCHHTSGNFLNFSVQLVSQQPYKLSQTIALNYDFDGDNHLIINLSKLKWS